MQQSLDLWLHSIAPHHHHLGIFDRILQALDLSRYIENMIHFWSVMLSTQFLMMPQQIEPVLSTLDYLGPVSHSQPVETDSSSLRPWDLSPHKHSVWNRSPESVIELASWECRVHVNQAILGLNLELTVAQLAHNSVVESHVTVHEYETVVKTEGQVHPRFPQVVPIPSHDFLTGVHFE